MIRNVFCYFYEKFFGCRFPEYAAVQITVNATRTQLIGHAYIVGGDATANLLHTTGKYKKKTIVKYKIVQIVLRPPRMSV